MKKWLKHILDGRVNHSPPAAPNIMNHPLFDSPEEKHRGRMDNCSKTRRLRKKVPDDRLNDCILDGILLPAYEEERIRLVVGEVSSSVIAGTTRKNGDITEDESCIIRTVRYVCPDTGIIVKQSAWSPKDTRYPQWHIGEKY